MGEWGGKEVGEGNPVTYGSSRIFSCSFSEMMKMFSLKLCSVQYEVKCSLWSQQCITSSKRLLFIGNFSLPQLSSTGCSSHTVAEISRV